MLSSNSRATHKNFIYLGLLSLFMNYIQRRLWEWQADIDDDMKMRRLKICQVFAQPRMLKMKFCALQIIILKLSAKWEDPDK